MDSTAGLFLERAENEHLLATVLLDVSDRPALQRDEFRIATPTTFYSAVISHSYYALFYTAKAYLHTKGIATSPPEEHRKVFKEFKAFVDVGVVDKELMMMYEMALVQADVLLGILQKEREKRTTFTYKRMPQANRPPAAQSVGNANKFITHLRQACLSAG